MPLVRLLADPAERVRELAAKLLCEAVGRLGDASRLLPTLVPALAERAGSSGGAEGGPAEREEPSEEIRLLLAQLVAGIVGRHGAARPAAGGELLGSLAAALCGGLEDPYADVKKAGLGGVHWAFEDH